MIIAEITNGINMKTVKANLIVSSTSISTRVGSSDEGPIKLKVNKMSIPVITVASTCSMSLSSNVIATLQPIHTVVIKEILTLAYSNVDVVLEPVRGCRG